LGKKWTEEILFAETEALSPEFLRQLQKAKEDRTSNQAPENTTHKLADPQR
jgi:hypothetical protein